LEREQGVWAIGRSLESDVAKLAAGDVSINTVEANSPGGTMRTIALLGVALLGCGGYVKPPQALERQMAVLGCWEVTPINFKSSYLPPPTRVHLASDPSYVDSNYYLLERLTSLPAGITFESNYWYISPGDHHVMMKLGDGSNGVWIDVVPEANGKRMYGRVGGANVRATRIHCPPDKISNPLH
jgi:hypothetical protein